MKYFSVLLLCDYVATILLGLAFTRVGSIEIEIDGYLSLRSLLSQALVMPFLETVAFQFLVIEISTRAFKFLGSNLSLWIGCAISAALFILAHYYLNNRFNGLVFGVSGGISLAVMYGLCREIGAQNAFFWTWMLHAATNLLFMASCAFFVRVI